MRGQVEGSGKGNGGEEDERWMGMEDEVKPGRRRRGKGGEKGTISEGGEAEPIRRGACVRRM